MASDPTKSRIPVYVTRTVVVQPSGGDPLLVIERQTVPGVLEIEPFGDVPGMLYAGHLELSPRGPGGNL